MSALDRLDIERRTLEYTLAYPRLYTAREVRLSRAVLELADQVDELEAHSATTRELGAVEHLLAAAGVPTDRGLAAAIEVLIAAAQTR